MAEVTGRTAESIDALLAAMVTSVRVDTNGQLIYKTKDGTETNAGPIVAPKIAVEKSWPVGSIFIATVPGNPYTLTGAGASTASWVRFGKGRTLISLDEANTRFDAAEETGGSERVTLTSEESGLRDHGHNVVVSGTTGASSVNASVTSEDSDTNPVGGASLDRGAGGGDRTINGSTHYHTFSGTGTAQNSGGAPANQSHENMSPYIVVYVWKRIT